jgi:hypothetical protein
MASQGIEAPCGVAATAKPSYRRSRSCSSCGCRELHPCRSSGVRVLVEYATEPVTSADVEVVESGRVSDRMWPRAQRCCAV